MKLERGDALFVADIQNDFLPGGSLAVPRGHEIVSVLLHYLALFQSHSLPIFAGRDWHPADHCSFRDQGGIWPPHCIAGSIGADAPPDFPLPPSVVIVHKATASDQEAYSAFEGTTLDAALHAQGVRRLFIGGIATDYCVLNTVKDALALGYAVVLLRDAIRSVNVHPDDGANAEAEMLRLGATPARFEDLAS
ncbi:MAG: isochorismatase family protein [Nitrospirota bacterium]|nr:isochorismatase family protein [Nitrospirota bacterium]